MATPLLPTWPPGLPSSVVPGSGRDVAGANKGCIKKGRKVADERGDRGETRGRQVSSGTIAAHRSSQSLEVTSHPSKENAIGMDDYNLLEDNSAAGGILDFSLMSCLTSSFDNSVSHGIGTGPLRATTTPSGNGSNRVKASDVNHDTETMRKRSDSHRERGRNHVRDGIDGLNTMNEVRGRLVTTRTRVRFSDESPARTKTSSPLRRGLGAGNQSQAALPKHPATKSTTRARPSKSFQRPGNVIETEAQGSADRTMPLSPTAAKYPSAVSLPVEAAEIMGQGGYIPHRNGMHTAWRRVPTNTARGVPTGGAKGGVTVPTAREEHPLHQPGVARVCLRRVASSKPSASTNKENSPGTISSHPPRQHPPPSLPTAERYRDAPSTSAASGSPKTNGTSHHSVGRAERVILRRAPPEARLNRPEHHEQQQQGRELGRSKTPVLGACSATRPAGGSEGWSENPSRSLRARSSRRPRSTPSPSPRGAEDSSVESRSTVGRDGGRGSCRRALSLSSATARKNLARAARASKVGTSADPVTLYSRRRDDEQRRLHAIGRRYNDTVAGGRVSRLVEPVPSSRGKGAGGGRLNWAGLR